MAVERQDNVREYYRLITDLNIGSVARELLGSHVQHVKCTPSRQKSGIFKVDSLPG